jgi:transcriptional regulator with GAF, ATPase, and Fis domain
MPVTAGSEMAERSGAGHPHLDMLSRITRSMATSESLPSVLESIVLAVTELPGMLVSRVWLHLTDMECDLCRLNGPVGIAKSHGERALHLSASAGALRHLDRDHHLLPVDLPVPPASVIALRRPERTRAIQEDPRFSGQADLMAIYKSIGAVGAAAYPLIFKGEVLGSIGMVSTRVLEDAEFELLGIFADQAAVAIKSAYLFRELARYRDRLEVENAYLQEEIQTKGGFQGIVGESPALKAVLRKVRQVAPVETTVLLTGETGTGKELIARALHEGSARKERPLIKINCGAIPQGVVESELFGHEKGAFTGALQRRTGRFELADNGTLFMDEVGELPLDTQVKLLRVLQEQEFERVGSTRSQKVDVRLVAATNRDLEHEVGESRFRADLYYRLNVFPIQVPPLRERPSDIPLLVTHFLAQFQRKLAKPLKGVTPESLNRLTSYPWPGNIRELQNVLERACVLSDGPVVEVTEALRPAARASGRAMSAPASQSGEGIVPLEENERSHIRRALAATGGKVSGSDGAAALLGINPSTLRSRMLKLGINK